MVGYQGLSGRSIIQRQSGMKGNNTHTGLAKAPAKWATEVSTEMTMSMQLTAAAVSLKSSNSSPKFTKFYS